MLRALCPCICINANIHCRHSASYDGVVLPLWGGSNYSTSHEVMASNSSATITCIPVWVTGFVWISTPGMSSSFTWFCDVFGSESSLVWKAAEWYSELPIHVRLREFVWCTDGLHVLCFSVPQTVPNHHWCLWRVPVCIMCTIPMCVYIPVV